MENSTIQQNAELVAVLKQAVQTFRQKIKELQADKEKAEYSNLELMETLDNKNREILERDEKLATLQEELANQQSVNGEEYERKLQEKDAKITQLQQIVDNHSQKTHEEIQLKNLEIEELKAKLNQKNEIIDRMNKDVHARVQTEESVRHEISALLNELQDL